MFLDSEDENNNLSLSKFESMLKTNKVFFFDSEEFEDIILHYLDTGKTNLAKKALKLALEQHPNSTGLKLVQVEMLIYEDKLESAEKLLNELYAIEPTNEEIYIQKANIYSKKNNHQKAVELLNVALEYTDDYADVYNLIGMEYLFMDNLENAKENFIKCLEEDYEDQSALYNVVYCFEFLDQNYEAIDYLNKYIDKNPYSEIAWHQKGRLYYSLKDYNNAVRSFEFATYIDENFIGAYIEKAKSLEKLKLYDEAIKNYNYTLEIDDVAPYVLLRIGKCYEKLGNKVQAIQHFNKTVHEDPLLDKGWIAITDFYIREKEYQKALYFVNKALEIDNHNKAYWKRYATINKTLKFYEEAEFGFRKNIEYGDNKFKTWITWIDLLYKLGEYKNAKQALIQAEGIFANRYELEYRLAGINYTLNNNLQGYKYLISALQLSFENHTCLKELFPLVWKNKDVQSLIAEFNAR